MTLWVLITQPLWKDPVTMTPPAIDPSRLEKHVRMLAETFFPRDETHIENLNRTANYLRKEFQQAKGDVFDQCYDVRQKTYCNVIARFGPDTKERIVVGAHYDAFGELPGADDNASGVAGLIELAYLLGKALLPTRVELVAFTLEEPPYFRTQNTGSAVHASSLKKQGVSVRIMISLEMIGFFSDADNSQKFPIPLMKLFYPSRGDFIVVVGKLGQGPITRRVKRAMRTGTALGVYSINAPAFVAGIDWSDHLYYWQAGYPAVMITDTSIYRNSNYHTENDTAASLDYKRMAMVVQAVFIAVLALAD